jgi:microcystin-dependent protein
MSSPFVGEIRMFGGNFAPMGWAFCDGSMQSVSQNDTLFSAIGATYGGDGQETFALPDLQGRIPIHQGQGTGMSHNYVLGEKGGVETVTLSVPQMPAHTHAMAASSANGQQPQPANGFLAQTNPGFPYVAPMSTDDQLQSNSVGGAGGGQPHENMAPSLAINFIISLNGFFPTQS